MIVIADSGSTHTCWRCMDNDGRVTGIETSGINPFYMSADDILQLLRNEYTLDYHDVSVVYFYGAGCLPDKYPIIKEALERFFTGAQIEVNTDLLGAARALCQQNEGIACILGTGSNSCYYNGSEIVANTPPLGYILGDEGSGAALGKKLLGCVLKKQLPDSICRHFFAQYPFDVAEFLDHVYRQPFPNRYLAQFSKFIHDNISHPALEALVFESFVEFFQRNIIVYNNVANLPLHFTGSVAYYFEPSLHKAAKACGLKITSVCQSPVEGLLKYHSCFKS